MKTNPLAAPFLIIGLVLFSTLLCSQMDEYSIPFTTRAIVFGVSNYQDNSIPSTFQTQADAELFAAFLRSRSGGLIPTDLIHLTTGEEATLANLASEGNWIQEESRPGDRVIIYLSCYARLLNKENNGTPYLFFSDSPFVPAGTGVLTLSDFLHTVKEISLKQSLSFNLYLELTIPSDEDIEIWQQWLHAFKRSFPSSSFTISKYKNIKKNHAVSTFGQLLINGLMSQADYNNDLSIMPSEIFKYMRKNNKKINQDKILFTAFSSNISRLSHTETNIADKKNDENKFPFIFDNETSSLEDSLLNKENQTVKQWYHDFIITMKLGKLIAPPGRCASDFYDSLATIPTLAPLYRKWQRKLGAVLLDETQQALNAYLKTDTRELRYRWKHANHYDIYPKYMEKAIEMIGPNSFFFNTLQTKLFYFRGLKYRMEGEKENNPDKIDLALNMQQKAISLEPEAAYVLNEIGLLYLILDSVAAEFYFLEALKYSPSWIIPQINLSIFYQNKKRMEDAMHFALKAEQMSPDNILVNHNLGLAYLKVGQLKIAEEYLRKTISLDIKNELAYYNLSCIKALQKEHVSALQWLEKSLELGYKEWEKIDDDPDLMSIRNMEEYKSIISKYKNK